MPRSHEASVAAGKKASETLKERYGKDHYRKLRAIERKRSTPGYFGYLKAQGRTEEISALGKKGAKASIKTRSSKSSTKKDNKVVQ